MKVLEPQVYTIPGDPVALARPRFGGNAKVYDSQKQIKLVCGITLRNQHDSQPFFSGPLHLDITFFIKKPVNKRSVGCFHISKPDLSNLIKFYEDIGTSILYEDDSLISVITARKIYDKNPRTEFSITPLSKAKE